MPRSPFYVSSILQEDQEALEAFAKEANLDAIVTGNLMLWSQHASDACVWMYECGCVEGYMVLVVCEVVRVVLPIQSPSLSKHKRFEALPHPTTPPTIHPINQDA